MTRDISPAARAHVALELIQNNPGITAQRLADRLGVTERAARRHVASGPGAADQYRPSPELTTALIESSAAARRLRLAYRMGAADRELVPDALHPAVAVDDAALPGLRHELRRLALVPGRAERLVAVGAV
jgi:hypothetical protein